MSVTESWDSFEHDDIDAGIAAATNIDQTGPAQARIHADQLLLARARAQRELAADEEVFVARLAQLQSWYDRRAAVHAGHVEGIDAALLQILNALRSLDPAIGPVHLPSGTISTRKQIAELAVGPEFVEWARLKGADSLLAWSDPVPSRPSPDKKLIRAAIEEGRAFSGRDTDGEPIAMPLYELAPLTWTPRAPKLVVKPATEDGDE